MREIIFRGKRNDNGEWVEGRLFTDNVIAPKGQVFHIEDNAIIDGEWLDVFPVDPSTVGQYTGLKDKNGKRIFEGDIVRHNNENPYATPGIVEKGEVYWCEEHCGWRRTSNGAFHHGVVDTYRMSPSCVYEVIGNIHDNSELTGGNE